MEVLGVPMHVGRSGSESFLSSSEDEEWSGRFPADAMAEEWSG